MAEENRKRQIQKEVVEPLRIIVASDIHYLSERLNDGGEAFQKMMAEGDGKYTEGCQMIMEAFVQNVCEEKPDAVLICGDLTFNGELLSLQDMALFCRWLKEACGKVFVICGNHDIEHRHTACYRGDKVLSAEKTSAETGSM